MEDHFPNNVNDIIQLCAKVLDIDPICSKTIKKLLSIFKEGKQNIFKTIFMIYIDFITLGKATSDIIFLALDRFLSEYFHLLEYLELDEEQTEQITYFKSNYNEFIANMDNEIINTTSPIINPSE